MKASEHERRDWTIVVILLLIGFLCVILAGQWALRFSPSWKLNANMGSNLDPNSGFQTQRSEGFIPPLDPSILTLPAWINVYLTPGASFQTRTPLPTVPSTPVPPTATRTSIVLPSATNTIGIFPSPTNTPVYFPPTASSTSGPALPPTNTSIPSADLQITKTDNATHYIAGSTITYTIIVSNPGGPSSVTGATVTDNFPDQVFSTNWVCVPTGGAVCTANGSGNIHDLVNLPVGSLATYTVTANIASSATGDLINTATVSMSAGYIDPISGNNSATDTDMLFISDPIPPQIGTTPDNDYYPLPAGAALTLNIPTVVNGHASWDLVYYEWINQGEVYLDWIRMEIGDGLNWYLVFSWGDETADTNTNMNFNILPPPLFSPLPPPEEYDQRHIPSGSLYNMSGIAIDLDGVVPPGTYPFIRITAPNGDVDGRLEIDAIVTLP